MMCIYVFDYLYLHSFTVPPRVLVVGDMTSLGVVNNSISLNFTIVDDFPVVQLQSIMWRFNGTILNNLSIPSDPRYSFSEDLLALTISGLEHSDQGTYTLTATNEAGTNSSSINLQIEGIIIITVCLS